MRTSALLRLGNSRRGQGGGRSWRGVGRGGAVSRGRGFANTQNNVQYSGRQSSMRGYGIWRGSGAGLYARAVTQAAATNTPYLRGLTLFLL